MLKRALILLFAGLLCIGMGLFIMFDTKSKTEVNTLAVDAVVTGYEETEEYDAVMELWETVYLPILSYSVNGTVYTETYSQTYAEKPFAQGETVSIHCSPDAPEVFTIDGDNRGNVIPAWMIPVGAVLLIFAVGDYVWRKRTFGRER